ncbi:hypothetical protein [Paracidovorax sp. MALMAid1276]|uniref:hypothetical protein n=1 Tax=Paracidovorax sp. MALMAid1276 TaxID=3411631 RepID=UPI003B9D85BD
MNFSLAKTVAGAARDRLLQWLKNINHQTKPALALEGQADAGGLLSFASSALREAQWLASPVCEGRCTNCTGMFPCSLRLWHE